MKFETFKKLMLGARTEYEESSRRDKALEQAIGGDTRVCTESKLLDVVLDALFIEYPHVWEDIFIEFAFKDSMVFTIDDIEYNNTIENLWMYCEGKLDESYSR